MTSMDTAWALIFILLLETGKPSPTLSLNIAPMNLDTAFSKDLEMLFYFITGFQTNTLALSLWPSERIYGGFPCVTCMCRCFSGAYCLLHLQ